MRTRRVLWQSILGIGLITLGGCYALLPRDWIEERLHIDPDAGSGRVESLVSAALIAIGATLVVRTVLARRAVPQRVALAVTTRGTAPAVTARDTTRSPDGSGPRD
jgi:hypothetical protein